MAEGELAAALQDGTAVAPPVFRRYADVVARPASTAPRNILLDFDPSEFRDLEGAEGDFLRIDDLCCDVEDGKFTLCASETDYEVAIRWDDDDARYVLTCPPLDQRFGSQASRGNAGHTLISFLNRDQAFRIVPVTDINDYTIYASRRFYRPRLPLGPTADEASLDLLRLFEGVDRLGEIGEEKGTPRSVSDGRWEANTLFGFVDSCGEGTILERDMNFDVLVCDNQGTEIADFLGLDTAGRRVVAVRKSISDRKDGLCQRTPRGDRTGDEEPRLFGTVPVRSASEP